ncbi:MAG: nucleotidyltransferase domain-containing protein, partial [Bacteroidia bacterium]|nr:nucleotidyltransferase domain-containing protein [Bacteroidia bacterium]
MEEKIQGYLTQIEAEQGITILLACETGSRAWGFPSVDSDYDVRLIYRHELDWYLSLSEKKDIIEAMLEDRELDIVGWDIRKCLRLLWKSNAAILERIQSPIIYRQAPSFVAEINELAPLYYSRIATMHHYLSMAKGMFGEVEGQETYKLKKLFYALRTAVASRWIMLREDIPPIRFDLMIKGLDLPAGLVAHIEELIAFKATTNESYLHSGELELIAFIKTCISLAEGAGSSLP